MTVVSESLNGRTAADGSADRVARVRHHLEGMGLGSGPTEDILAMLRKHGAIGPGYLLSQAGADRVNAAWSGEAPAFRVGQTVRAKLDGQPMTIEPETADSGGPVFCSWRIEGDIARRFGWFRADELVAPDDLTADADHLDLLADELSGASTRGDELSDDVLAAVLADLVPRKASPEALVRALAVTLQATSLVIIVELEDTWRILGTHPKGEDPIEAVRRAAVAAMDYSSEQGGAGARGPAVAARGGVGGEAPLKSPPIFPPPPKISQEIARGAAHAAWTSQTATPAADAVAPPLRSPGEGRGEMGNLGDKADATGKGSQSDPLLADVNRILRSAGCTPMPEGELLGGPMPTSTPGAGFPPTKPEPETLEARIKAAHGPLFFETSNNTGNVRAWVQRTGVSGLGSDRGYAIKALARNLGLDKPDPPCSHKAVVPDAGAEICPGCGDRVSQPPPTVGRLRRVLFTKEERDTIACGKPSDSAEVLADLGLPPDASIIVSEWRPEFHMWLATIESASFDPVRPGQELERQLRPYPRHGR